MSRFEITVVGAGIVGLAVARELLLRHPGVKLAVLEKEPEIGRHQTGHNSGVIHSGLYYAPGSLKARLCVAGMRELYAYCKARGIPTEACGKVIVAAEPEELPRLRALHERGLANGVEGLELIGPERLREIEPHCRGVEALWSPRTGIVDFGQVARAFAEDVRQAGGELLLGRQVSTILRRGEGVALETPAGEVESRKVIACAGLHSDRLARASGGAAEPAIIPFRGSYWVISPRRRHLARNLIYPVPDPAFPFLGVHFTRRIGTGEVWCGPNAVLAFAREGYRRRDLDIRELGRAIAAPAFRRLARRHWRMGLFELVRDYSKQAFLRALQRYIPELEVGDLEPGPSGVRAQALWPDGRLVDDFVFDVQGAQVIHVRNAPSPAATASLAIAREIADQADRVFGSG